MDTIERLLLWCVTEQNKLRRQIADLESDGKPDAVPEIEALKDHLANLDYVRKRLRS
jgi:hypothetical protein